MSQIAVGVAVTVARGEIGVPATVIATSPTHVRCQLEDGRNVWVPAERVRVREGATAAPPAATVAQPATASGPPNPYAAPTAPMGFRATEIPGTDNTLRDWKWLYFSLEYRASRTQYWLGNLGVMGAYMVWALGFTIVFMTMGPTRGEATSPVLLLLALITGAGYLALLWASLALGVKRWHDRNKSGWWSLINLFPILGGLWALVEQGFLPGTPGRNDYGPNPAE